jgi:hypothetical protein
MSIFNDDFGSSIPSLSLTLNKYYLPVPFFCLFLKKGMGSRDSFTQISSIFHPSGKIKPPGHRLGIRAFPGPSFQF